MTPETSQKIENNDIFVEKKHHISMIKFSHIFLKLFYNYPKHTLDTGFDNFRSIALQKYIVLYVSEQSPQSYELLKTSSGTFFQFCTFEFSCERYIYIYLSHENSNVQNWKNVPLEVFKSS